MTPLRTVGARCSLIVSGAAISGSCRAYQPIPADQPRLDVLVEHGLELHASPSRAALLVRNLRCPDPFSNAKLNCAVRPEVQTCGAANKVDNSLLVKNLQRRHHATKIARMCIVEQKVEAPKDYEDLIRVIHDRYDGMSKSYQKIALYLTQNPNDVAVRSVNSIGESSGVHASSFVRFAQALGYEGFKDLQSLFQKRLSTAAPGFEARRQGFGEGTGRADGSQRDGIHARPGRP